MTPILYPEQMLRRFCQAAFETLGFTATDSALIADVLLLSDLYGIESHGVQRIFRYHKGIRDGSMRVHATPRLVHETPISAVFDADMAMGQLTAHRAMSLAIDKACSHGVGMVTARNANHYGIAGYYAKMASDAGFLGISCTNTAAVMVPTFGKTAMLGTNPIAVAMPADPFPFFFDASTTVVARGKVEVYAKAGKPLPDGWALDEDGAITMDAEAVVASTYERKGGMLPLGGMGEELGGYKGYGYGILCELFSAILAQGETSNHVSIAGGGVSHGFIAVDPGLFGDRAAIRAYFSTFLRELRESPKAEGCARIYTHGEKEMEAYERRMREGIPVLEKTIEEMRAFCTYVGLHAEDYLDLSK